MGVAWSVWLWRRSVRSWVGLALNRLPPMAGSQEVASQLRRAIYRLGQTRSPAQRATHIIAVTPQEKRLRATWFLAALVGVGVMMLLLGVHHSFWWSCPAFVDSFRLGARQGSWGGDGPPFVVGG